MTSPSSPYPLQELQEKEEMEDEAAHPPTLVGLLVLGVGLKACAAELLFSARCPPNFNNCKSLPFHCWYGNRQHLNPVHFWLPRRLK